MPVLTGVVTYLALSGTPGLYVEYAPKAADTVTRTYTADFTRLSPAGVSGKPYGSFAGKAVATEDTKVVAMTFTPVVTFGDVSTINTIVSATFTPIATLYGSTGYTPSVSADFTPVLTFGVGALSKSGTLPYAVSADFTPVLTFDTPAVAVEIGVTADFTPVLTFASGLDSLAGISAAADFTPVLTFTQLTDRIVAYVSWSMTATFTPSMTMSAAVVEAGEVDNIRFVERPCGHIRINEI